MSKLEIQKQCGKFSHCGERVKCRRKTGDKGKEEEVREETRRHLILEYAIVTKVALHTNLMALHAFSIAHSLYVSYLFCLNEFLNKIM